MISIKRISLTVLLLGLLSACAITDLAAPSAPVATRPAATSTEPPPTRTLAAPSPLPAVATANPTSSSAASPASTPLADTNQALAARFDGAASYEFVRFLTSAALAGRKAGAPGADMAADYLASIFSAAGLKPAGDNGTFFQTLTLPYIDLAEPPVLDLLNADGTVSRAFKHRLEFSEIISGRAGDGRAEGRLVFLGRGATKDLELAGDLTNSIAMISPSPATPRNLITLLSARGVIGLIEVTANPASLLVRYSYVTGSIILDGSRPVALVSRATADEMLDGSGVKMAELEDRLNRDGAAYLSTQARVRLSVKLQPVHDAQTRNVLGVIPGSDPALSSEVLIVGGHYDHVGADPGGAIFEGANDNASGSAVVAGLAQFFGQNHLQAKRTIVFAAWTGEEAGLVGSQYYVKHPLFPLKQTKGYINLDVVGAGQGDGLTITNDSPSVGLVARSSATDLGIPFNGSAVGGGSDHESFLQAGVPATFFIWQRYGDIHVPSDTFDKIDPLKLQKTGQVAALTLLRLADSAQ